MAEKSSQTHDCRGKYHPNPDKKNQNERKSHCCKICSKTFTKKSSLTCHMRLHTGEKPYKCVECELEFTHKSTLLHHMRLHTGEKPYVCGICDKRFRQRSNYTLHGKVHTKEKPYKCIDCGKQFAQRVHLTTHVRLHTGEKPYTCDECDQKFFQRSHLTRHIKNHKKNQTKGCEDVSRSDTQKMQSSALSRNAKPRQLFVSDRDSNEHSVIDINRRLHYERQNRFTLMCEHCKKIFIKKSHLRNHMFIHTGEKPFSCTYCGKRFAEKSSVTRHQKVHKGKKGCSEFSQHISGHSIFTFSSDTQRPARSTSSLKTGKSKIISFDCADENFEIESKCTMKIPTPIQEDKYTSDVPCFSKVGPKEYGLKGDVINLYPTKKHTNTNNQMTHYLTADIENTQSKPILDKIIHGDPTTGYRSHCDNHFELLASVSKLKVSLDYDINCQSDSLFTIKSNESSTKEVKEETIVDEETFKEEIDIFQEDLDV